MSEGTTARGGDATYLERMALLGEMFAEAAHEINNLMGAACAYAELELSRADLEESRSHVPMILDLTRLAGELAMNVLHFSTPVAGGVGDVEEAVKAVLGLYAYRCRKGMRMATDFARPLPPVALPAGHLLLALANLVRNALDALEGATDPCISIAAEKRGGSVAVRVWNSGPPIAPEVLRKLFGRNVTTKRAREGTGLGLSIAHRLVTEAGGTLIGTNAPEGGVAFVVTLPAALLPAAPPAPRAGNRVQPVLKGRRILVIDDDDSMRNVLQLVLSEMAGGEVRACASGEEALRRLDTEAFDAVVLDLRMPGLSGQDTFERMPASVRKRVVFITGDALRATTSSFLAMTRQPALVKPIAHSDLVEAIRRVTGPAGE